MKEPSKMIVLFVFEKVQYEFCFIFVQNKSAVLMHNQYLLKCQLSADILFNQFNKYVVDKNKSPVF